MEISSFSGIRSLCSALLFLPEHESEKAKTKKINR
jgi:hypothetical protein